MKKNSILLSITLAFASLFLFIILSFVVFSHHIEKQENHVANKRAFEIARIVHHEIKRGSGSEKIESYLELLEFSSVKEPKKVLENKDLKLLWQDQTRRVNLKRYALDDSEYLLVLYPNKRAFLVLDEALKSSSQGYLFALLFVLISAFSVLYLQILKKLKPLKNLQQQVKHIGEENFEIECASSSKDEIAELANEFYKTAKKLKQIKESRNIFIRNIMHELKTPIAKGQFLMHLPDTQENRHSLQKVFYRLESLISEFASIEELLATKQLLVKKEYKLSDLLDNALDLLMCEEDNVELEYEDIRLRVDFKLFSIALKNLIDNGIKYSSNKKVLIKTEGSFLIFENRGEALEYPLKNYFEPFYKNELKTTNGFGLGLYIVKHILDVHGMDLEYEYHEGLNRFKIKNATIA